jgi:hypothetical protein
MEVQQHGHPERHQLWVCRRRAGLGSLADGPEQIRQTIRAQVKYGVDVIKILASGGVLSKGECLLPRCVTTWSAMYFMRLTPLLGE